MLKIYILWVREKYVPAKHNRYGDPWDEKWKVCIVSENEQAVYETANEFDPKWQWKITSYEMDTVLLDGMFRE